MLRTEGNGCVDGRICDAVGPERFVDCVVVKDENEAQERRVHLMLQWVAVPFLEIKNAHKEQVLEKEGV